MEVEASGDAPKPKPTPEDARRTVDALFSGPQSEDITPVPSIPVGWGNVVTDTMTVTDPAGVAKRLREELSLGDGRTDYGRVLEALDRSARNLDDAGRLHRAARLEEVRYEAAIAPKVEILRARATEELMNEYRLKKRASPTQKDIEDRMVGNWGREYLAMKERLAELHGAVGSLEVLRDAWSSRCADLRVMADKARPH